MFHPSPMGMLRFNNQAEYQQIGTNGKYDKIQDRQVFQLVFTGDNIQDHKPDADLNERIDASPIQGKKTKKRTG
jgi:hypothetical protein